MAAIWKIEHDGNDITDRLAPHFVSLSLSDERGITSDDFSFTLEDVKSDLELPAAGNKIKFWLGDDETGLIFKGLFTIDELESSGPPDIIEIRTNAADFTKGLKVKKEAFFTQTTIGDITSTIAGYHNLKLAVSPELESRAIDHLTQTNESDLNLLKRLAKDNGAYFDVKNETLIFSLEAITKTTTGLQIPTFDLDRSETETHRFSEKARKHQFTGAKAAWNDTENSVKKWELIGDDDKVKALSGIYPNETKARDAAQGEFDRLQRGELSMSITLSRPAPALIPETPVKLSGFKPIIANASWVIKSVRHVLGDQGLRTDFDMETQLPV